MPDDPKRADAFVQCACGSKHWGLNGAAGVLLWRRHDDQVQVLLQLRAGWSHHGGFWAVPGGAIDDGETALQGALREFAEETGISMLEEPKLGHVLRHPDWSYTTFVAKALPGFINARPNRESEDLKWVAVDEIESLNLLPAFREALPLLLEHIPEE